MADIIPNVGLARAVQLILDDISHAAVGSGTTTPATTDIKLVTETDRLAPTKTLRQNNEIQARTFFANADLPTTVEEAGWFMNGSATPDSGSLLTRATFTFTKGSQDLYLILKAVLTRA